ncbi:MAG: hypothetical protein ACHQ9S_23590 [Candidatus Binatia bacterium]
MSKFIMLIAPLTVALMAAPALAHRPHGGGACSADLQTLCPNVTPGPGSFRDCLATLCPNLTAGPRAFASCLPEAATSKGVTLSDQCQAHLTKMQAKIAAWQMACGNYAQLNCTGDTGPRAIGQCLRAAQKNDPQFPAACAALLAQHHGHHHHHGPAGQNGGQ